jgi:hypothetical protein
VLIDAYIKNDIGLTNLICAELHGFNPGPDVRAGTSRWRRLARSVKHSCARSPAPLRPFVKCSSAARYPCRSVYQGGKKSISG